MSARPLFPLFVALFILSCAQPPTRIELTIEYEDAWNIGLMEVRGNVGEDERDDRLPVRRSLEIWLPESWAGEEVHIYIRGLRGADDAIATGRGTVVPALGESTPLTIRLHRVPCGAWCTTGETQCFGDAVAICERRDSDGCMVWGTAIPCSSDAPYCSLGQCRAECIDECAEGEQRCNGPDGYQLCGNFDGDPCREWSTTTTCSDGQSCHGGACTTGECRDQCTSGATACRGSSIVTCGDLNDDGCTEWGPAVRCGTGTCQGDRCVEVCTNDCEVDECAGTTFHECGQFDEDPCLDRSPGLSCTPIDLCLAGTCSATTGCTSTARTCDSPPEQTCINPNTLRVYDAVGECTAGECNYAPRDIPCANCPSCDPCAAVTCNTPPVATCASSSMRRTFASSGTCSAGTCNYTPTDTACNRPPVATCANSTTRRTFAATGTCMAGECTYTPIDTVCNRPPEATCINTSTLRTHMSTGTCTAGECSYSRADMTCPNGCMNGACRSSEGGTWTPMPEVETGPSARWGHSAVWTGSEMIIWGGNNAGVHFWDGYRYSPSTNSWAVISADGAPSSRNGHSAVWTGSEMIIWGGGNGPSRFQNGSRYNPSTNSWAAISTDGAPSPRSDHSAVWTGSEMIIWGGSSSFSFRNGYRYDPTTNTWAAIEADGAPPARDSHSAVWTGSEMIIWGGFGTTGYLRDGYRYDPATNTWAAISTEGAPSSRSDYSAVWTGSEMIIWGGNIDRDRFQVGYRYIPATNSWGVIGADGAPSPRSGHSAVWTGGEMIIWGGWNGSSAFRDGGRWRP